MLSLPAGTVLNDTSSLCTTFCSYTTPIPAKDIRTLRRKGKCQDIKWLFHMDFHPSLQLVDITTNSVISLFVYANAFYACQQCKYVYNKKNVNILKGLLEAINQIRTENTMAKRKGTIGQCSTQHYTEDYRCSKTNHTTTGVTLCAPEGCAVPLFFYPLFCHRCCFF